MVSCYKSHRQGRRPVTLREKYCTASVGLNKDPDSLVPEYDVGCVCVCLCVCVCVFVSVYVSM